MLFCDKALALPPRRCRGHGSRLTPPPPPPPSRVNRRYSNKYGFRKRSETPDIAIELSLQPWRAFQPDGVIMFSDILTPLPALGIEFDVVKGKGPIIPEPVRTADDLKRLRPLADPASQLPFIAPILGTLRREARGALGPGKGSGRG